MCLNIKGSVTTLVLDLMEDVQRQNRTDLTQNRQYHTNMGGNMNLRSTSL